MITRISLFVWVTGAVVAGQLPRAALPTLEARQSAQADFSAGTERSWAIAAHAGEYLEFTIDRDAPSIQVFLVRPDGQLVDTKARSQPSTRVVVVVDEPGFAAIRLVRNDGATGTRGARIHFRERRRATASDTQRITADALLSEAVELQNQGSGEARRAAIEKLSQSLRLWEATGDDRGTAEALIRIGTNQMALGDYRTSLAAQERAADLLDRIGDLRMELDALSGVGVAHNNLGAPAKALETHTRALGIAERLGDRRSQAIALHNRGAALYRLGDYHAALESYTRALDIKRAINDDTIAVTLSTTAAATSRLGSWRTAIDLYQQALAARRATGDKRGEGLELQNIGATYVLLDDWRHGLDYLSRALPILRAAGDKRNEAQTLHNMGRAYSSLAERELALEYYGQALALRREVGDPAAISTTVQNMAAVHVSQGAFETARSELDEALALSRGARDKYGEVYALGWAVKLDVMQGQTARALEEANQSLRLGRDLKDPAAEAAALHQLGGIHLTQGDAAAAAALLAEALSIRERIHNRRGEAETRYLIAKVEQSQGLLEEARAQLDAALSIVDTLRAGAPSPDLRSSFLADNQQYYDAYIEVLMTLDGAHPNAGYAAQALATAERARARRLLDTLAEANVDFREGAAPGLVAREQALSEEIAAKETARTQLLAANAPANTIAAVEDQLGRAVGDLREVRVRLRAESPRYAALTSPAPLTISGIQDTVLDGDSILLEFWLGANRSYLWQVTRDSIQAVVLPPRVEIDASVRQLYSLLTARQQEVRGETLDVYRQRIAKADAAYAKAARALSSMLFGSVRPDVKRWVLVPDGALEYLPFGALPLPAAATAPAQPLLLTRHEIVRVPSASAIAALRNDRRAGRSDAAKTIAIFADPVFTREDVRVKSSGVATRSPAAPPSGAFAAALRSVRESGLDGLRRLTFSRTEADAIAELAPASARLKAVDFAATRAAATGPAASEYGVVHFATHALLNSQHPELSAIVLSLVDENGDAQNGFLRLHEIYNLRLNADLVVLSACQTALGPEIRGDGLAGLARGFMYAGAPRVIASLWRVDDRATAELMRRFYRHHLRGRQTAAASLRAAITELAALPRWSAPYYWAGFVFQGEWQ